MSTDCNAKNKLLKSVVVAKNLKAYMSSTFFLAVYMARNEIIMEV